MELYYVLLFSYRTTLFAQYDALIVNLNESDFIHKEIMKTINYNGSELKYDWKIITKNHSYLL